MKLIVVSSRYSRTSRAYPDDKAYRRHWPSNPALTHMLIILSWLVASVQMVSFQVKGRLISSCRFNSSSVWQSWLFLPRLLQTRVSFHSVCSCFWPNLAETQSGAVFADINVVCEKNSMKITWKIAPELVPYAARFFLGNCMASKLNYLTTGDGELSFSYNFAECKFKKLVIPG